jgi:predicted metal-dependent phosphoesterase TrpH
MSTEASVSARQIEAVDLHLHSVHSDGVLAPGAVVDRAAEAGAQLLALTDHDTLAGLDEARERCAARGVRWVTGVEISCTWRAQTIHVLALDFDSTAAPLHSYLDALRELRRERLRDMARRLERKRIPASQWVADIEASSAVATRTHLARALVAAGHARSLPEAFKRYLGRGSPGYVGATYPPLARAVEVITGTRGAAVLAHPLRYALSAGARRQLLQEFRDAGGRGIEVVCGGAQAQIATLAALAQRFGLEASAGSDFHDPQIPWNPPGRLAKLPASVRPVWHGFGEQGDSAQVS